MSTRSSAYIPLVVFLTLLLSHTVIAQNEKKIAYGILMDNTPHERRDSKGRAGKLAAVAPTRFTMSDMLQLVVKITPTQA